MAARTPIAPHLRMLVDDPWTSDGGGASTADAARELRALLRVARAVYRVKPYTPGWEKRMERVFDAHDALARVSGRQRKGGRP